MSKHDSLESFKELAAEFFEGKIGRRQFIRRATQLGISIAILNRLAPYALAANESLVDSDPSVPHEAPITKERIEFLKSKPYKGTTIDILVLKATVGDGLKYWTKLWQEETGGQVNVAEVPIDALHTQIFADLTTGRGRYDSYMTAAWFYGDYFTGKEPFIVEIEPFLKDPKYPYWDPAEFFPAMKNLYTWQGKLYGVLFDSDAQILYYRRTSSATRNSRRNSRLNSVTNYQIHPKTAKEMLDVATFFTGWDWNGDGKNDWGISLHAKVNEQGFFHFLTLAGAFVVSPDNKYFFFNPETMKPLINSEGHLRALEHYAKFLPTGPKEAISWTLGQGWNLFLSGNAVLEPTWGDLPTFAQEEDKSKVRGKMGAAPIPGTDEAFDPISGKWQKYDLNQVGNTNGGSWHCVISRFSKKKEATYDFLAFMANKKNAFYNTTHGFTGVQPGMKYEFLPPHGTGSLEEWVSQGWNADDATAYMNGYYDNLALKTQMEYLRIPGAAEYWHELDVRVSAVLAGQTTAKAALDDTYKAWEQITERYGREGQKKLYQASFVS